MPVQISVSMKLGVNASARPSTLCQLKDLAKICQMLFQQLTWNTEGDRNSPWSFEIYPVSQYRFSVLNAVFIYGGFGYKCFFRVINNQTMGERDLVYFASKAN